MTGTGSQPAPHRKLKRLARRLSAAVAISTLALTTTVSLAAPETAEAVSCYGDYCSGKDPVATGCSNGAYAVNHARIPGTNAYVQNIWSPTCKTQWARVTNGYGQAYPWKLSAVQNTGYTQQGAAHHSGSYSWTNMIYTPSNCVRAKWTGSPGSTATACW